MIKQKGWIPLDKNLVKHLPRHRPFSEIEAMFSLSCDYDNENPVTVSGYARRWQWSRNKVKRFLKVIGAQIIYDKNTLKTQNQKGQIAIQIRDRKGTDKGQIRAIDNRQIDEEEDRKGTDKEQIKDRSRITTNKTINKNLNFKDERTEPDPPQKPLDRLKAYLASVRCSEKFIEGIFQKYKLAEIVNAALILRSAKSVDNPEAFLNRALNKKWRPRHSQASPAIKSYFKSHSEPINGKKVDHSKLGSIEEVKRSRFYLELAPDLQAEYLKGLEESELFN